ncbi:MAG: hypothetical protein HUJ73_00245 [Eubacterium sp.]|nr:hypothetical protein [Eubacterium sp.]
MKRKFLDFFRVNLGLKILSVIIAVVIWYVVVNISDPVETKGFSVKVTVENEGYIANGKKIYRIDDDYKTVTVFAKANRSVLNEVTEDDISVVADLTQIVDMNTDPVRVPLSASCRRIPVTNLTLSRTTIPITIENIATLELPVTVSTGETTPSQEYEVGRTVPNPDSIVVKGPESIINSVDSAVAVIDVTGMTQDSVRQAKLVLYDKNSKAISESTIEDDLTITGGTKDVTVYVELWKRRSDVSLNVEYDGRPAEGYHVDSISTTPQTVTVVGSPTALKKLKKNGNTLTIPASLINIDGAASSVSTEIPLADILPDEMRPAKNTADIVVATISILSDKSVELKLDVDNIKVKNLNPTLALSYEQTEVPVLIRGDGEVTGNLNAQDIVAAINLEGLEAGEHTIPVRIKLPEGAVLEKEVEITITLKEIATPVPTEAEEPTGNPEK